MKKLSISKLVIIRATTVPQSLGFFEGTMAELVKDYDVQLLSSPGERMNELAQKFGVKTHAEGMGVAEHNYKYKGLYMDIFIMESSPKPVATICHFLVGSMRHFGYVIKKRNAVIDSFYWLIKKIVYGLISFFRMFCVFSDKDILRHTLGTGLERKTRKKEFIFPLTTAQFEGIEVPVPGNYHGYLQRMFGDYMKIPDPSAFHTHNIANNATKEMEVTK